MMPHVFKKTAHVEDLYWQLTRFQSEVNMSDAVGRARVVLNLKHCLKALCRKFMGRVEGVFISSGVM